MHSRFFLIHVRVSTGGWRDEHQVSISPFDIRRYPLYIFHISGDPSFLNRLCDPRSFLLAPPWKREGRGDLSEVFTSVHSKSQKGGKGKRATCQTFAASKVVSFFFSKGKKGSQWRVILPLDLFPFRTWSWWKFYFGLLNKVCVSLIHIWCRHHLFLYQNVEPSDAAVWSCQRFVRHACFHHSLLEMWTDEGFLLCPKVEPQNSLPVYSFMFTIFRHFSFRE